MKHRTILISGASVAGLTLAYWLRRYGFNPTVLERASAPRTGGQAIDLRGTAREVAERMEIMSAIRQMHTGTRGMSFVDRTGKRVASMGADLFGDSGGPIAEIEILRGDLIGILYTASRDAVEYLFDDSITSITQRDNGVDVTFEREAPRTFDLVVGADGLHSNVRRLVFGAEAVWVRDMGAYVSIFTTPTQLDLGGWELMYSMPGTRTLRGKTAALYPLRTPGEAIAMFFFAAPVVPYDRHASAQQKQMLAHAFSGEGWVIPQLLDAMWAAPDFYFDRISQVHMDAWSRGRVVLLGDASYCGSPLAGNGSSMALVGAYVLAGELVTAADNYGAAFAQYEHEMRDYVARCQRFAQESGGALLPTSAAQIWVRNQGLRMLPYMPWKDRIIGSFQQTVNAVTLKDYLTHV